MYGPLSGHCLFADARQALFPSLSLSPSVCPSISFFALRIDFEREREREGASIILLFSNTSFFWQSFLSLSLFLLFTLVGRGGATLEKTCWKSHNWGIRPVLDIINVDRWRECLSVKNKLSSGGREKFERCVRVGAYS